MRRLTPILALFTLLLSAVSQAAYHTRRAPEYVDDFESLTAPPVTPKVVVVVIVVQADFPASSANTPTGPVVVVVLHQSQGSNLVLRAANDNYDLRVGNHLPEWGTFTGPDMRIDVMEANGACNYLFCSNNPVLYIDPTGLIDRVAAPKGGPVDYFEKEGSNDFLVTIPLNVGVAGINGSYRVMQHLNGRLHDALRWGGGKVSAFLDWADPAFVAMDDYELATLPMNGQPGPGRVIGATGRIAGAISRTARAMHAVENLEDAATTTRKTVQTGYGAFGRCRAPMNSRHVFTGEINRHGRAVGYHHKAGGVDPATARVTEIIDAPNAAGVCRARVQIMNSSGEWVARGPISTLFPDAWSAGKVLDEITSAFVKAERNISGRPANYFEGVSQSGVRIGGYLDNAGNINTAFPIY
jgi:hypothetical protein